MTTPNNRGGSVSVQRYSPSIDLCLLIECLNKAIPAIPHSENKNQCYPLVALHSGVKQPAIVVHLEGVLSRLTQLIEFHEEKFYPRFRNTTIRTTGLVWRKNC